MINNLEPRITYIGLVQRLASRVIIFRILLTLAVSHM
jgi:hypothetical protein